MKVYELIEELQKISDQSREVIIWKEFMEGYWIVTEAEDWMEGKIILS